MKSLPIVAIIIKNRNGLFFIHQRRSDKKIFPNMYGLGAGGRIETDESIQTHDKEWQWSGWMEKEEIDALIATKQLMPDTMEFYKTYIQSMI